MPGLTLYRCRGGDIVLPQQPLCSREDGGNLVVHPSRNVWERSELDADELTAWSFLVAATGRAMIDVLPQLAGGCVNYWEAGNWALNDAAEPRGRKTPRLHRRVHLHLLGRSVTSSNPRWRWGEAPSYPDYGDRLTAAAAYKRLTPDECVHIVEVVDATLSERYLMIPSERAAWLRCTACHYPTPVGPGAALLCSECMRA